MRVTKSWVGAVGVIAAAWGSLLAANVARAEVAIEHPSVASLAPSNGHRLYVWDFAVTHAVDSKVHIFDGDTGKFIGQLPGGQWGFFNVSRDGQTLFTATTYFTRGDHGDKVDSLELWDPLKLELKQEIILPTKRAPTLNYSVFMVETFNSAYLLIQNATPASSITVVDLPSKKVLAEIPTAGCFGIFPSTKVDGRFSTLCGDGAAVTIDFDSAGKETARQRSEKLFDPDKDALFMAGMPDGDKTVFVSFLGKVHSVDFSGPVATQETPWSFVKGKALAAKWRPGGYQLAALHQASGQLYVGMHANGKEGSHKEPAQEIWKIDLRQKKVLARAPGGAALYMTVTQEPKPLLFTLGGWPTAVTKYNASTLAKMSEIKTEILEGGGAMVVR